MANVRKRVDRQQSGKSRLVRIEEAFKGLLRTCAELPIAHRERFIFVLLKQTCLPGGTACYVAWGEWNFSEIKDAFRSAGQISPALAKSWYKWARALSNDRSSCRPEERVRWLIVELVEQIFVEQVTGRSALDRQNPISDGVLLSEGLGHVGPYGS
jgi:hypothetical protein